MIYGYCRCSKQSQTTQHQHYEIQKFAKDNGVKIDEWIEETISSRKPLSKRRLGALLDNMKEHDVLITPEISRIGRSLLEVMSILQTCLERNCQIWTIKENYRLGADIQSKVLAFAFGLAAEIERQLISQRTKASLESLKKSGKKLGRPFGSKNKALKLSKNRNRINNLLAKGLPKSQIARILGVDKMTMYRFLRED